MFNKLFMKMGANTARKEQDAFLELVKVGTDQEMADSLASAAITRALLDRTEADGPSPFPHALFRGQRPIDDAAKAELSMYNMYLAARRKSLQTNQNAAYPCFAAGFSVYMFSFRSLVRPELFATGRSIWRELMRGTDGYLEAMSHLGSKLSEEETMALFPAPNVLAPSET